MEKPIKPTDTFSEACNKMAELLPGGFVLTISLERECGFMVLENPDGDEEDLIGDGRPFYEQLNDALELAVTPPSSP